MCVVQVTAFGPQKSVANLDLGKAGILCGNGDHYWVVYMTDGLRTFSEDGLMLNEGVRGALVVPALFDAVNQSASVGAFIQTGRARMEVVAASCDWTVVGRGGKARRPDGLQQQVAEIPVTAPKPVAAERVPWHGSKVAVPDAVAKPRDKAAAFLHSILWFHHAPA